MDQDFYCQEVFSGKTTVRMIEETAHLVAFHHTKPAYEFHVVIVPREHTAKLTDLNDIKLIGEIFEVAKKIIVQNNLDQKNFRIITNGGSFQDSKHLHFHLISGNKLI